MRMIYLFVPDIEKEDEPELSLVVKIARCGCASKCSRTRCKCITALKFCTVLCKCDDFECQHDEDLENAALLPNNNPDQPQPN